MGASGVNATELVEQLWRDIKRRDRSEELTEVLSLPSRESTADSATLRALNVIWDIPIPEAPALTSSSLKARARHRAATFILGLLRPYFEEEKHFRARAVQMLNALSSNDDAIADEVRQVAVALRVESQRLVERADLMHELLEARLDTLERRAAEE